MKVVLATAPETALSKSYLPPLGIGYIAGYLEKAEIDVSIVNAHLNEFDVKKLTASILSHAPDMVGFTGTTPNRFQVIEAVKNIKKEDRHIFVFVGGPHFSLTARDMMEKVNAVDAVVRGEGEETVRELVCARERGHRLDTIQGITYRSRSGDIVENSARPPIEDLDTLPGPPWDRMELERYEAVLEGEGKTRAVGVLSTRGCPFECVFCANNVLCGRMVRKRSPVHFVDELEYLHTRYGIGGFDFWDDTLTMYKEHLYGICREIKRRGLEIKWYARANVKGTDREVLESMRDAGCVAIGYGIESGSPAVLKRIKKQVDVEKAYEVVKLTADLGFTVKCFFMVSLPGEEISDIELTLRMVDTLQSYGKNIRTPIALTFVLPGTGLEQEAVAQGILEENYSWNTYRTFAKSRLYGEEATLPYYEGTVPLERIVGLLRKYSRKKKNIVTRAVHKLSKVRSIADVQSVYRLAKDYILH